MLELNEFEVKKILDQKDSEFFVHHREIQSEDVEEFLCAFFDENNVIDIFDFEE